jgi:hypothetical protein
MSVERIHMSHESIVYGFIEGAASTLEEYRKYQLLNLDVLESLPEEDEYPFLARGMFSAPEMEAMKGTFRAQVIHFGGSISGLCFEEVPIWVAKMEDVLRRLYWSEATAHVLTDYIDGTYRFQWSIHDEILATYHAGTPRPTTIWIRNDTHDERHLLPHR